MSRQARQDSAGAIHLIRALGKDGELPLDGLVDEAERAIGDAASRAGWELLGKEVAASGYRLLIYAPRANLSSAMQALQRDLVSRRENFFPKRQGQMFRDRFFSKIITKEEEFAKLAADFGIAPKWPFQHEEMGNEDESILAERLAQFGVSFLELDEDRLQWLPKSASEKHLIAAFIRENCAISVDWISDRLLMGHPSAASRGIKIALEDNENLKLDLARMQMSYNLGLDS